MYSTPMLLAATCECRAKAATSSASLPMVLSLASSPVNTLNLSCTCALIIGPTGDCNPSLYRKGGFGTGTQPLLSRFAPNIIVKTSQAQTQCLRKVQASRGMRVNL